MKTFAILLLLLLLLLPGCGSGGSNDHEPPTITNAIITPSLVTNEGSINGTAVVHDNIGVKSVKMIVDFGKPQCTMALNDRGAYTGTLSDLSDLTSGDHQICIEATDSSGNITRSVPVSITVECPPAHPDTINR
jgi:hypothetical protein